MDYRAYMECQWGLALGDNRNTILKLDCDRLIGAFHQEPAISSTVSQKLCARALEEESSACARPKLPLGVLAYLTSFILPVI